VAIIKHGGGKPPLKKHGTGGPPKPARDSRAPEQTFEEVRYIKQLIDDATPVRIRLRNNEEVAGTIEYYDHSFIRLTRTGAPNLFIYKHDIKYLREE
jgi:sRNA-binding regulator protein Hfq